MSQSWPHEAGRAVPPIAADPTRRVARPPVPGRSVRAEGAAGSPTTPPVLPDEPTVTLHGSRQDPRRTLEFGTPVPVKVTVGPRPRPRRRHRTTPWIVGLILALVVIGVVLVVMLLRGATIDAGTDLLGSGPPSSPAVAFSSGA